MKAIEMLDLTTSFAKKYKKDAAASIKRNSHMNEINQVEVLDQRHIDAVLTDFINFIAANHGIDYALYASEL